MYNTTIHCCRLDRETINKIKFRIGQLNDIIKMFISAPIHYNYNGLIVVKVALSYVLISHTKNQLIKRLSIIVKYTFIGLFYIGIFFN